mgnify:CR=1 FL=1
MRRWKCRIFREDVDGFCRSCGGGRWLHGKSLFESSTTLIREASTPAKCVRDVRLVDLFELDDRVFKALSSIGVHSAAAAAERCSEGLATLIWEASGYSIDWSICEDQAAIILGEDRLLMEQAVKEPPQ